jgi:hypothetical protein
VVVEGHEVEMQILDAVLLKDALALDELGKVEVVEEACFGQREELSVVVEGALVALDADHAGLTHVEALLVGRAQTVAQTLRVFQKQVPALGVVQDALAAAHGAGSQGVQGSLCIHIIDVVLLRSEALLGQAVEAVGSVALRVRLSRIRHYQAFRILRRVHHHHVLGTAHRVVVQVNALRNGLRVRYHVLFHHLGLVAVLTCRRARRQVFLLARGWSQQLRRVLPNDNVLLTSVRVVRIFRIHHLHRSLQPTLGRHPLRALVLGGLGHVLPVALAVKLLLAQAHVLQLLLGHALRLAKVGLTSLTPLFSA